MTEFDAAVRVAMDRPPKAADARASWLRRVGRVAVRRLSLLTSMNASIPAERSMLHSRSREESTLERSRRTAAMAGRMSVSLAIARRVRRSLWCAR